MSIAAQESSGLYSEYVKRMQKIADIRYASALLQWDQETYMPAAGAPFRGQQIATLTESAHEFFTSEITGNILEELKNRGDLTEIQQRNISLSWEDYSKQKKYDSVFVRKMAETINKSFHQWIEARKQNDFSIFLPLLSELVVLKREEAHILGFDDHPYNALLNEHDKGSTVKLIDQVFDSIRTPLKNLLDQIQNQPQVEDKFLFSYYPKDKQWQFGLEMLRRLGYDFNAGRQDISEHPFSVSFNSNDVRITTRINENDLGSMTWSCIHELGHAFYEQGLPDIHYGLPLGEAISYTIHESQSRLWENHVGRSGVFCETWLPLFISYFPGQLKDVSPLDFFAAINKVNPSLIRTEADELTYHFHVMIRYELEKKLVEKSLDVADIPAYWNENYRQLLNVAVPDDLKGCLQDVHWSHGSFGYFPTYSLGSFYASQFYATATREIPLLEESLRKSDTRPLLHWLRNQIHRFGRMYTSEEMSVHITGEGLNVSHFIKYLTDKYRLIYKLPV